MSEESKPHEVNFTTEIKNGIKRCNFCGITPNVQDTDIFETNTNGRYGSVVCVICGATGPEIKVGIRATEEWQDEAIEKWNTRAGE